MGNDGSYLCEESIKHLPSCVNVLVTWLSASLSFKGGITLSNGFYNVPESLGHHHLAGIHSHGDALPAQPLLSPPGLWLLDPTALAPDLRRAAASAHPASNESWGHAGRHWGSSFTQQPDKQAPTDIHSPCPQLGSDPALL